MRITRNNDYIEYFINGGRDQKRCNNLRIEDNKLFNYNTVICEITGTNEVIVNITKYSTTTSRLQNAILKELDYKIKINVIKVDKIAKNTQTLKK